MFHRSFIPEPGLMSRWGTWVRRLAAILLVTSGFTGSGLAQQQAAPPASPKIPAEREAVGRFLDRHCLECHNGDDKTAGLDLDVISSEGVDRHPGAWEKVVRRLVARQMPPAQRTRPEEREYDVVVS